MKTRAFGLILFWFGALYIFCASWLAMWWIAPIWRNSPVESFEGTSFEFGGPVFTIIALSVPVGIVLTALGVALYSDFGKAGRVFSGGLATGLGLIALSQMFPATLGYHPNLFGIAGGLILLMFLMSLWYWARVRNELGTTNPLADIFQLFSYVFFYLAASTLCAVLGNPFSGLYFPEKVLQQSALPFHYSMGTKIALYFVLGWFCILTSQYQRHRVRFRTRHGIDSADAPYEGVEPSLRPDPELRVR